MENLNTNSQEYKLSFNGKGGDYFGIIIVNWLLTILTLGFYYPWAKAKQLQYIYKSIALNNDPLTFHGTGKEMFKGFIKALIIIGFIFGLFFLFFYLSMPLIGFLVTYLCFFAIIPVAIHGSYRYRMSRTSWRGIRFGYRGNREELVKNFFIWFFYTIVTIGIYGAWFAVNLRNYVISHIKFGDIEFRSTGEGSEYFFLNLKGYFFTIFTLGIYMFWWQKDLFAYYVNNISMHKGDQKINLSSTATGGGFFELIFVNLLIIIFTLGLGYAWVATRTMTFIAESIRLNGDIDLDSINQTEENFKDATGEDLNDFLDIDFIV